MEIEVIRDTFTNQSTIGKLYVDGQFTCYTLEDKDRGLTDKMEVNVIAMLKQYGVTCIPYGRYKVELTHSPAFKRILPEIKNVKGYEGVRIHTGNTADQTLGCILVGMKVGKDKITDSTPAFNILMEKLKDKQEIYLTIKSNKNETV